MTTFNPQTHPLLFLTDLTGITDFASFQASGETIWAVDAVLSCLATAGLLDIAIQDAAPTGTAGQKQIWVDPAADPTDAASSVKIYDVNSNSWQLATLELTVQLIGRIGNFTNVADNGATFAEFENESAGAGSLGVLTIDTLSSLFHSRSSVGSLAIGVGASAVASSSVAVGSSAGFNNTGGSSVLIGRDAGSANAGSNAVAVGRGSGSQNTRSNVTAIGYESAIRNAGASSTFVGSNCGSDNLGDTVIAIGYQTARSNSGVNGIFMGRFNGDNNTGVNSISIGTSGLSDNTGDDVVAIGRSCGSSNTGSNVVLMGVVAGDNNSGSDVTIIGNLSGRNNSGQFVTAIGRGSASNNEGSDVVAVGRSAAESNSGESVVAVGLSTGQYNEGNDVIAVGRSALSFGTCQEGIAIGTSSLRNAGGVSNVAIGARSGLYARGSENTYIGNNSGPTLFTDGSPLTANFNPTTQIITTPAHGFSIGQFISMKLTSITSPTGMTNGQVYVFEVVSTTTLRSLVPFSTTGVSCNVTPSTETNTEFSNSTGLGFGATPTLSNQVRLGDNRVEQVSTNGMYLMGEYTPGTLPPVLNNRGSIAYLRNGTGTGQNICVVHCDGTNWRKVETGEIQA